jgi:integrin alpha FG-GAP repeat containing protein 1
MVYAVCASVNAKTGLGQDCAIHISYNSQMPLCTPKSKEGDRCRPAANLCTADPDFAFDLSKKSSVSDVDVVGTRLLAETKDHHGLQTTTVLPLDQLIPDIRSPSLVMLDTTQTPALPLPLRIGDYNMDGYPDLLAVIAHGGGTQAKLLESLPCRPHHKECATGRTFRAPAKGTAALDVVLDVRVATFFDVDDDVRPGL